MINIEAIKTAAANSKSIREMQVVSNEIDPRQLTIDSVFYTIVGNPVDDTDKSKDATMYVTTHKVEVESLSKVKEGYITVNGTIDLPLEAKHNSIFETYFKEKEDAIAVCRTLTSIEWDRLVEKIKKMNQIAEFLAEQTKEDRFI